LEARSALLSSFLIQTTSIRPYCQTGCGPFAIPLGVVIIPTRPASFAYHSAPSQPGLPVFCIGYHIYCYVHQQPFDSHGSGLQTAGPMAMYLDLLAGAASVSAETLPVHSHGTSLPDPMLGFSRPEARLLGMCSSMRCGRRPRKW
jgi:hypothetical protein